VKRALERTALVLAVLLSLAVSGVCLFYVLRAGKYLPRKEIGWVEAEEILRCSPIESIATTHRGRLYISTRWGFRYVTKESGMIDVRRILLEERGLDPSEDFSWAME